MKRNNFLMKNVCVFLIVFLVFSTGIYTNCIAATSYTQTEEINNVATINDTKKVWSIQFNKNIDESSIPSNIYIVDGINNKIDINSKLLSDKKTVEISVVKEYEVNKSYKIYINNIKSEKGEELSKQVIYSFMVEPLNSNIVSIKTNVSVLLTYIQINTSKEVFKVTVNNVEMKYEGDNNYTLGLQNIGEGDNAIIKTFDGNNKLLEQKEYIISR